MRSTICQEIVDEYYKLRQQYFTTIDNIDLYLEIEELIARDQFVRKSDDYISGRREEDVEAAMQGVINAQADNNSIAEKKASFTVSEEK
ncbi:MAG: hypothetical protein ACI8QQ_002808 [Psychroserpens sp.]|jgi:hypothetical protein